MGLGAASSEGNIHRTMSEDVRNIPREKIRWSPCYSPTCCVLFFCLCFIPTTIYTGCAALKEYIKTKKDKKRSASFKEEKKTGLNTHFNKRKNQIGGRSNISEISGGIPYGPQEIERS